VGLIDPLGLDPSGESGNDGLHNTLDVAGFVPGFGAVPDLLNAILYATEGDVGNAGLSLLVALPIVGDGAGLLGQGLKPYRVCSPGGTALGCEDRAQSPQGTS
jgi:hypothetical protein